MKKSFLLAIAILAIVISWALISSVSAEDLKEDCICLQEVEITFDYKDCEVPKIEKFQIYAILKKKGFKTALINFYDELENNPDFSGIQLSVIIVTGDGQRFEGTAGVNRGKLNSGMARAVENALIAYFPKG